MFRKKRQPGPHFKMPGAPYAPITGERALLGRPPAKGTTLGIFQVIGDDPEDPETQDTHDNYVVCRGYEAESDPNFQFLYDPYTNESPDAKAIHVAKPYGVRGTFPYTLGQVIVAARIFTKLGYTPGKAENTVGHPADLDEEIGILLDDEGVAISWMDISTASSAAARALAIAGAPLAACDLRTPSTLTSLAVGNMPNVTASIRYPHLDGADVQFDVDAGTERIYNPTPFSYGSGDLVWVVRSGSYWLVERAADWRPIAAFRGVTSGTTSVPLANSSVVNAGGIATGINPGGAVIECPVSNRPFRVSVDFNCRRAIQSGTTPQRWKATLELLVNGSELAIGGNPAREIRFDAETESGELVNPMVSTGIQGEWTSFQLTFDEVLLLSKDDEITGSFTIEEQSVGGLSTVARNTLIIEPLF